MNKIFKVAIPTIFVGIFVFFFIGLFSYPNKTGNGNYETYNCDVKNIRLTTDIEISKDDEYVRKVKGKLKLITDPLKLSDTDGNKIGYAGDDYEIIGQDNHLIRLDKTFYSMQGKFKLVGNKYLLYDEDENFIGTCEFNFFNTKGYITNANDEVIANYKSKLFYNDYDVLVYENCELDEDVILLICASYYSDQKFDASRENQN